MTPTNPALLAAYAADSKRRGLQPSTIEMRTIRLRAFSEFLGKPFAEAAAEDVERFLAERRIEVRTRYCWLSHLGCFYRWGVKREHFEADPTAWLDRPKLPRLLPRPVADDDLATAIAAADRKTRAMLLLASHMGLRCIEISRLHANDVLEAADPPAVLIHGKGGRDRAVPLHPVVAEALQALPRRGWLFCQPLSKEAMTPAQVSIAMRQHLRGCGVDATGHQLRHWFATRLYQTTHDLRLTQELLGHSSPTTTAIYTAWARSDAAAAVRGVSLRSHPPGGSGTADR